MSSPQGSTTEKQPVLERLISHFVAAKKSLVAIRNVQHANDVVAAARLSLETIASLNARKSFCQKGIDSQINMHKALQESLETVLDEGEAEFTAILKDLDAADIRIKQTLEILKSTTIERTFRPEDHEQKCLHDFVDEQGVNELRSQLRESIYTVKIAHGQLAESIEKLDVEVKAIDDLLENCNPPGQGHDFSTLNRDFRSLEQHAAELADLLEALVRHYDLCITAIKHTEGGGDLIEQVKIELPEGTDIRSLEHLSPPQPMDDEERAEMMQVLDKDAAEVEDVVQEISDHAAEMEAQLQRINSHLATLQSEHNMLSKSSTLLDGLGGRLGSFIQVCADYKSCWDVEKHKIEDKLVEFEAAREFYEGFLQAYDGLILEVARRKAVKGKMRKIMHDAMAKVGRLYNEEVEERESFKHEQGEYLPSDIWPGLGDAPSKYAFQETEDSGRALPEISKDVLRGAIQRNGERLQ